MTIISDRDIRKELYSSTQEEGVLIIKGLREEQIQPSSVDIRIGDEGWESEIYFKPTYEKLEKYAKKLPGEPEYILSPGKAYYFKSFEKIKFPWYWNAILENKSTNGRIFLRVEAGEKTFAEIGHSSYPKSIELILMPLTFPILVRCCKTKIAQIRFREFRSSYMSKNEIDKNYGKEVEVLLDKKLLPLDRAWDDGIKLTFDTSFAYKAKDSPELEPLDLTKKDYYDPEDYFEKVFSDENGEILTEKNSYYLFGSMEYIKLGRIVGKVSREDPHVGATVSLHEAGYVDSGYEGYLTFEVRSYEKRAIEMGEFAGRLSLEGLSSPVERRYGDPSLNSSYQHQKSPKLAKIFKEK